MENDDNKVMEGKDERTTIKLENIKRNLTSEKIFKILEKIFSKKRTYNAIYTLREKDHIKNSGICYINFVNNEYIYYLSNQITEFSEKKKKKKKKKNRKILMYYPALQGEDFIKKVGELRKNEISLDFIVFSDFLRQ